MQTIQQQRARFALEAVNRAEKNSDIDNDRFKKRAAELPAMIQMNGLGQAAAFYRMKGKDHGHIYLYNILSAWLCRDQSDWITERGPYFDNTDPDLLHGITHSDVKTYRLAQAEALLFMDWVKKFAKAYMPDEKEGGQ